MDRKIVVRAAFNQHWYDNYYRGPDPKTGHKGDIMPANEDQARRLTQSGQGYYDFVEDESTVDQEADEVPTMSNTKKEIEQYLDDREIEYDEYATKSELLELIDGE